MNKFIKQILSLVLAVSMIITFVPMFDLDVFANSWTIRTTYPTSNDSGWKYYSSPINNYPLSPVNGGNCTWYAYGRAYEVFGKDSGLSAAGDAGLWYSYAQNHGMSVGSTPKAGSIICWSNHVAFVEAVNGNAVTWTESSYAEPGQSYPNFNTYTFPFSKYHTSDVGEEVYF